jgi:hypothetical protein
VSCKTFGCGLKKLRQYSKIDRSDVNILLFNKIFILWKKGEATPATEYHHKRLSSSQLERPLQKVLAEKKKKRNMKSSRKKNKERLIDVFKYFGGNGTNLIIYYILFNPIFFCLM